MGVALGMLACARCGAGLPVWAGEPQVTCCFCGAQSVVDAARARWSSVPERAHEAEHEGLAALRDAFRFAFSVHCSTVLVSQCVLLPFIWAALILDVLDVVEIMSATLLVTHAGGAVYLVLRHKWAPIWAARRLDEHRAAARSAPTRAGCPNCGAPVQVPPLVAVLPCCFCHATLVASEGMLIGWEEEAEARSKQWKAAAMAIMARAKKTTEERATWLIVRMSLTGLLLLVLIGAGAAVRHYLEYG